MGFGSGGDPEQQTRRSREQINLGFGGSEASGFEGLLGALLSQLAQTQGIIGEGQRRFGQNFENFQTFTPELLESLITQGQGTQRAATQANLKTSAGKASQTGRLRDGFAGADARRLAQEGGQAEAGIETQLRAQAAQQNLTDFAGLATLLQGQNQAQNPILGLITQLLGGGASNLASIASAQSGQQGGLGSFFTGLGSLAFAPTTGGGSLLSNLLFPGTPAPPVTTPGIGGGPGLPGLGIF